MDANALELVTVELKKRLELVLKPLHDADDKIDGSVYVGALDDRDAMAASIVLCLYRIGVTAELLNSAHDRPMPDGSLRSQPRALPLNLHYLLTAGSLETGSELLALRVLGHALRALHDDPVLAGLAVEGETVRLSLDPLSSEEMGRVWSLFPTVNYRTSVAFLASPVWIDPVLVHTPAPVVREEPHRVGVLPGS